jgi:hypothetical protein
VQPALAVQGEDGLANWETADAEVRCDVAEPKSLSRLKETAEDPFTDVSGDDLRAARAL